MSLDEVKGQERAIKQLKNALSNQQLAHAYLFTGPAGIGKKKAALKLAEALNCYQPDFDGACGLCLSCRKARAKNHPDIFLIEAEGSSLKIDQIRALKSKVYILSQESKYKVFLIDDAHLLTLEGANSLLKVLEEPPENTVFVLITAEPQKLPVTILSRCQEIKFLPLEEQMISEILLEKYPELAGEIDIYSKLSQGSLARASLLLEEEGLKEKRRDLLDFLSNLPKKSYGEIILFSELFERNKAGAKIGLEMMQFWFRDLLIYDTTRETDLLLNKDYLEEIKKSKFYYKDLKKALELLQTALKRLEYNVNPRLVVEVFLLEMRLKGEKV